MSPESLRAHYGTDQTRNAVHGSDSYYGAEREIRFMFPGSKSPQTSHYCTTQFHTELNLEMLQQWNLQNNNGQVRDKHFVRCSEGAPSFR